MNLLILRFTKISPTHHRFEYETASGKAESAFLETKSFLLHDFLHFAMESEAKLTHSFYGSLSEGVSYDELNDRKQAQTGKEIINTERVVGPLTSVIKGNSTPKQCLEGILGLFEAYHEPVPAYVSETFILNVKGRMRNIMGEWNKTPFGKTMELIFRT